MLDHGRISGFLLLLDFNGVFSYYLCSGRSLLDEHLPTWSCVGMSVSLRVPQAKLLVLSRLPATNEQRSPLHTVLHLYKVNYAYTTISDTIADAK